MFPTFNEVFYEILAKVNDTSAIDTHTILLWYIYLHERLIYGINVGKYTIVPWILWDMYDVGIGFLQFQ